MLEYGDDGPQGLWIVSGPYAGFRDAYIQARYQEKAPRTIAEMANSRARRVVDAARVPRASLDILRVWEGMWTKDLRSNGWWEVR